MPGLKVESVELSTERTYMATETALVECVEGNPYSKAADPDIVIRCRGGESGRGRQSKSLRNPLKKTPEAKTCTSLRRKEVSDAIRLNLSGPFSLRRSPSEFDIPTTETGVPAPEENRQEDGEKGMGA